MRASLRTKVAKADILKALARLSAVFGPPRDRPEALAEVMAGEWLNVLGALPLAALDDALAKAIRTLRFFPAPAEILALAQERVAELRAGLEHEELRALERPSLQLTRGHAVDEVAGDAPGRPREAQPRALSAACANWRALFAEGETLADRIEHWAPASQDGASDALKQSRLVRGEKIP